MLHRTRADLGIIRPADIEPEPWANGLGVTRVLAARPAWRISLAEIEGRMPFSPFLGADRVLIPLSPEGLTLEIGGAERHVAPLVGEEFPGEEHVVARTACHRVVVVNVISRRSSGRMHWEISGPDHRIFVGVDALVVLYGQVYAGVEQLPPGTVVSSDAVAQITFGRDGVVALLRMMVPTV